MQNLVISAKYPSENSLNNLSMPIQKEVSDVLSKLLNRDYSNNTRLAIFRDVKNFFVWYLTVNNEMFTFRKVTERDVRDYRDQGQKKSGLSVATINRRLITLGQFFKVAKAEGLIRDNPAENVKQLDWQPLAPKGLQPHEVRKLLKEVELRKNLRDIAIIQLMLGAGLRVSEVVSLTVADVELSERKGTVIVRRSKGNKTRAVPLKKEVRDMFGKYLESAKPKDRLFLGQRGALTPLAINKIVEKYGKAASIHLHPHLLRHTFAFNFLKENPSEIVALSQILGHSNINTTAIYTQNRLEDLQEKVEKLLY